MPQVHTAEQNITASIVGGIKFGEDQGMLVDGDLTSLAAAKAAVDADQAKKHTAEATFGERIKGSLDLADSYVPGYTTGSETTNIYPISNTGVKGRSTRF